MLIFGLDFIYGLYGRDLGYSSMLMLTISISYKEKKHQVSIFYYATFLVPKLKFWFG